MDGNEVILSMKNVYKEYPKDDEILQVLEAVNFDVKKGSSFVYSVHLAAEKLQSSGSLPV